MIVSASEIGGISAALFRAAGATEYEARLVTDELVESSLMGLDSHGVMRIAQ